MDDPELKSALGHIFRSLVEQRRATLELQKTVAAMLGTLRTVPGFAQPKYSHHWDEVSRQLDGQHSEAMQKLEQLARLFE
jgi:hypothetical protein